MRGLAYPDLAIRVLSPFVERRDRAGRSSSGWCARPMRHSATTAVCPLVQAGPNRFILELFHGPTLAFKDVAMQLLARLMDHVLAERGSRATIAGATSGDTGGAAIEAFAGRDRTDIFILFPNGRVSPVQQRQMTTSAATNVHALAIEGNFDDCQALVKDMFNDHAFRDRVSLSGVNSINWARIMAQIVYYFSSATSLGSPDRPVSFTVPTGNFGDMFAGYAAKRMGLPIDRLVIATNDNDILARTFASGVYETRARHRHDLAVDGHPGVVEFRAAAVRGGRPRCRHGAALHGRPQAVRLLHHRGSAIGDASAPNFDAARATMAEVDETIRRQLAASGYLLDPHTATGIHVADTLPASDTPMVVLATAHPAKFPAAVDAAAGIEPRLPDWLGDLWHEGKIYGASIGGKNGGRLCQAVTRGRCVKESSLHGC